MSDKFLIVKLSSIGDVIMATPIARALRQAKPDAYIAWVVEPKSAGVLVGNPYIDDVIVWQREPVKGSLVKSAAATMMNLKDLARGLRKRRFDAAIDAQGLLRSALVTLASGARWRIGYSDSREASRFLYNRKCVAPHTLSAQQRYLHLLRELDIESTDVSMTVPILDEDRQFAETFFRANGLANRRVAAMMPATTWPNKHWKVESWAKLADTLARRFHVTGLILGSKADTGLADRIIGLSSARLVNAAGETTLRQAAALLERSAIGIGVDTGLMHASVALNKPTIGIFGPSIWRVFAKRPDFIWLTKEMPCSPCHRHPTCDGYPCIWGVSPEEVVEAAGPYLVG